MGRRRRERVLPLVHGVISRERALEFGMKAAEIDWLVESGQWKSVFRGVYLVGPDEDTWTQLTAALEAFRGVARGVSAAAIWKLDGLADLTRVEIMSTTKRRPEGIHIHQVDSIDPRWVRKRGGFRVLSPPRTLLDLCGRVHQDHVEAAMDHVLRKGWATWRELEGLASARAPGNRAVRLLRELLGLRSERRYLESLLETRFLQLMRYGGLPRPTLQRVIETKGGRPPRVDFIWPEQGVIAETLGYEFHGMSRDQFINDARRSNEISRIRRYSTLRFVWDDVHQSLEETCRILMETLGGRWDPSPATRVALIEFKERIRRPAPGQQTAA